MLSPNLNENLETPLYQQLYLYIKKQIKNNILKTDDKLPSKRSLSNHLGISINTITNAYEMLIDEGYLYSVERTGYFVSDIDNLVSIDFDKNSLLLREDIKHKYKYNLKYNNIDTSNFPLYNWKKSTLNVIDNNEWLESRDSKGLLSLRKCICKYLYNSRNVVTSPDNIIISSGLEYLFQILFYVLPDDSIYGIENPGFKMFKQIFDNNNLKFNLIDIDKKGISIKDINKSDSNIICVTPSHQFPTGVIMPIDRRVQLLNWANKKSNRFIIEDDYDSEFKYYGKPIPALKSLDKSERVIYLGNFSKSLTPTLRVSYMVLPDDLMNIYNKNLPFINCPVSSFNQLILCDFIENKYFERYLNRMRNIYKEKREIATSHIIKNDKNKIFKILGSEAGLHFILEINKDCSEDKLIRNIKEKKVYVESLSSYYEDNYYDNIKLLIGFAGLSNNDLIKSLDIIIDCVNKI